MERGGLYPAEFANVLKLDPELGDGAQRVFRAELPVQVRMEAEGGARVGVIETLSLALYRREEYGRALTLKLALLSPKDLFFLYRAVVGAENFEQLRAANDFELSLEEFAASLLALLGRVAASPEVFFVLLTVLPGGAAQLEVHQNLQYKHVPVLSLALYYADRAAVNQSIMYRYSVLLAKSLHLQKRLGEAGALLRAKNAGLLAQLRRQFALE